jgi:hypothetical protein
VPHEVIVPDRADTGPEPRICSSPAPVRRTLLPVSNPYGNDPYGQQPPNPYGGAPGGGFNAPVKTDGVSIASLVLSLLCCAPVGLILGFVGIKRTKGGQRKGRGLAITGIVLGLLGVLAWVGMGVAAVAGVAWFDSLVTPEEAEVGQCINIDTDDDTVLMREAECDEEHDGEIVGVAEVTDENLEQVQSEMSGYCLTTVIPKEDLAKLQEYITGPEDIQAVTQDPNDVEVGDDLVCYIEPSDKLDEQIL